jgi:hypothetical protein
MLHRTGMLALCWQLNCWVNNALAALQKVLDTLDGVNVSAYAT